MSAPKRTDATAELGRLEDALVDSILNAEESNLREEVVAAGEDPDDIVRRIDTLFASAERSCARERLHVAQEELRSFRAAGKLLTAGERALARARFEDARSRDDGLSRKLLLAARKGQQATERDVESLVDDLAELNLLEETGRRR